MPRFFSRNLFAVVLTSLLSVAALTAALPVSAQINFTRLGSLGGTPTSGYVSLAYGVSADGGVVAGVTTTSDGYRAYRWTAAGGMASLGNLGNDNLPSLANDVSSDGNTIVGQSQLAQPGQPTTEAFQYTQSGGMVGLGDLPGGIFRSVAYGVSANGSVIVGHGQSAAGMEAFRYTQLSGMVSMGELAGGAHESVAFGVSGDGNYGSRLLTLWKWS